MSKILVASTKVGGIADFNIGTNSHLLPCGLVCNGLSGAEKGILELSSDDGASYAPAFDYNTGAAIELDVTHNAVGLSVPGKYRFIQPATALNTSTSLSAANAE